MSLYLKSLFIIVLFFFSLKSYALKVRTDKPRKSPHKSLRVVAPYLPENVELDGKTGRDIKIFKRILRCFNYDATIDVQPYMRHLKSYLTSGKYDAIMTLPGGQSNISNQTESYIAYHNGAIVRSEDFPQGVKNIKTLKGKHIISFLGGESLLKGLKNNTSHFASYTETGTQYHHNEMLMKNRVDAVFSDGLIFMAHQKRLLAKKPRWSSVKVKFYQIFSLNHFYAAFRDKTLTKQFNRCLNQLNKDGTLNSIEKSYTDKYHDILGDEYAKPLIR